MPRASEPTQFGEGSSQKECCPEVETIEKKYDSDLGHYDLIIPDSMGLSIDADLEDVAFLDFFLEMENFEQRGYVFLSRNYGIAGKKLDLVVRVICRQSF